MYRKLHPIPVVFACGDCERDAPAREVAAALDRRGLAEAYLAGAEAQRARARFPVFAIEGCEKACATAWLASLGVRPRKSFILDQERTSAEELERIARLAS